MKRTYKLLLAVLIVTVVTVLLAVTAAAVPARPGSGHTGEDALCRSHHGELVTLDSIPYTNRALTGRKAHAPSLDKVSKNIPLAIIVVGFDNMPYSTDVDWGDLVFMQDKSLSEFYSDMSLGQFTFEPVRETSAYNVGGNTNTGDKVNDGVIHVVSTKQHIEWIGLESEDENRELLLMFKEAIELASEYVDFSIYDADGDGVIGNNELALGFVVAGYEASATEEFEMGREFYMWSHAWAFGDAEDELQLGIGIPETDGVKIDSYIAISEFLFEDEAGGINVFCHELGHYLGLPDLYDIYYLGNGAWSDYSIGMLSVMDAGSWGMDHDDNYIPHSMDVWSRSVLGWVEPEIVSASGTFSIAAQNYEDNSGFTALRIPTANKNEYYLVENRQFEKWDAGFSRDDEFGESVAQGGLIFWHIDDEVYDLYNFNNEVNVTNHRPGVMPLYPEYNRKGDLTLIGSYVDLWNPFFDASSWDSEYAESLGSALDLPVYGDGIWADKRASRTLSGIKIDFLNDSADVMDIEVDTPVDPEVDTSGLCRYCGQDHSGSFLQRVVGFFHRILWFLKNLFK